MGREVNSLKQDIAIGFRYMQAGRIERGANQLRKIARALEMLGDDVDSKVIRLAENLENIAEAAEKSKQHGQVEMFLEELDEHLTDRIMVDYSSTSGEVGVQESDGEAEADEPLVVSEENSGDREQRTVKAKKQAYECLKKLVQEDFLTEEECNLVWRKVEQNPGELDWGERKGSRAVPLEGVDEQVSVTGWGEVNYFWEENFVFCEFMDERPEISLGRVGEKECIDGEWVE